MKRNLVIYLVLFLILLNFQSCKKAITEPQSEKIIDHFLFSDYYDIEQKYSLEQILQAKFFVYSIDKYYLLPHELDGNIFSVLIDKHKHHSLNDKFMPVEVYNSDQENGKLYSIKIMMKNVKSGIEIPDTIGCFVKLEIN